MVWSKIETKNFSHLKLFFLAKVLDQRERKKYFWGLLKTFYG
jgi:hypothetical protein